MRIRAISVAVLLAVGLVGCTSSSLAVFDRPQADSDEIDTAAALELDPTSTRLLWEGDGRHLYAAQHRDNPNGLCLVMVPGGDVDAASAACSPSERVGLGIGGEEYLLLRSLTGDESPEWERLAEGLWRKR